MRPTFLRGLLGLFAASLTFSSYAAPLQFELRPDRPVVIEGAAQDVVLRLNLHADPTTNTHRAPLNLCLVLDKSGSMGGNKIERLREAALQAMGRMGKEDILSIIAFSNSAQVLFPATKLRDTRAAAAAIESLQAEGSTAIYAGVKEGLAEINKFRAPGRVSRIILISDGLANVGPSSPADLAALGREAGRLGVPVTTFGLGMDYGEDLMTQLAMASDGNHAFIPDEGGIQAFLDKEMGDVLSVAARDLIIRITLAPGVTLRGSLDRAIEQDGRNITWHLNQLPGGADKRLLLEVAAPALKPGQALTLASAKLSYLNEDGKAQSEQFQQAQIQAGSAVLVEEKLDKKVLGEVMEAKANQKREQAIGLMDSGDRAGAAKVLQQSSDDLKDAGNRYGLSNLDSAAGAYAAEATSMAAPAADANNMRKSMKAQSYKEKTQQTY